MTDPLKPAQEREAFDLKKALHRAFSLGQAYWQQADSDSYSQNRKSQDTHAKFDALVAEALTAARPQAEPVAPQLWLWQNFVDGRPEFWAFDNPFPVYMDCDDPQTLGEPCGYALVKPSRPGRLDVSEAQVLRRIKAATPPSASSAVPEPLSAAYELDDVDRELLTKVRKAVAYDDEGDPARDVIDEDEMIDGLRLLLLVLERAGTAQGGGA